MKARSGWVDGVGGRRVDGGSRRGDGVELGRWWRAEVR